MERDARVEANRIEACIREYFGALLDGKSTAHVADGDLAEMDRLAQLAGQITGEEDSHVEWNIGTSSVEHVDGDTATGDVAASTKGTAELPDGTKGTFIRNYTGPVQLKRVDSDWKVVDYLANGRSIHGSSFLLGQKALRRAGVAVKPVALEFRDVATLAYISVENERREAVALREAVLKVPTARVWWRGGEGYIPAVEVPSMQQGITPASWTPLETYPKRVRLKLSIGAASGLDDLVDFSFELALAN